MSKQRFIHVPLNEVPIEVEIVRPPDPVTPAVENTPPPPAIVPPLVTGADAAYSVLLLGKDPLLLETRARILWGCGHSVEFTQYTADAMERLANSSFDFVVICHTVKENDREAVMHSLEVARRRTRVVCLYRGTHGGVRRAEWVDISDPENLVEAIAAPPAPPYRFHGPLRRAEDEPSRRPSALKMDA